MADRKISDLTALTTPATGDLIPIVDVSEAAAADKNKSITVQELFKGVPDGTAAAPGLAFESDDGNGIFLAGTDQVGVATGGVERVEFGASEVVFNDGGANYDFRVEGDTNANLLFVDASTDRVGVGTASPGSTLDVNGVINLTSNLTFSTTTTPLIAASAASSVLRFGTGSGGTERVRIDSSGRVGIGTSSPSTRLHVLQDTNASQLRIESTSSGNRAQGSFVNAHSQWDVGIAGGTTGQFLIATATENVNLGIYTRETGQAQSEKVSITAAGNVGIGTTSPGSFNASANNLVVGTGSGNEGITIYGGSDSQSRIDFKDSADTTETGILYYAHSSDAMIVHTAGNERARITSSGQLLVGTSSSIASGYQFQVKGSASANQALIHGSSSVSGGSDVGQIDWYDNSGNRYAGIAVTAESGTSGSPGRLVFSTTADGASSPTERMRISADGRLSTLHESVSFTAFRHKGSTGTDSAIILFKSATTINDGTACFVVRQDGDVENTNNAYGALSDAKLKENIVDATSQWDDLKAIQVRKYNFKEDTGHETHTQIGVVAQEVELVSPGLVSESPDRDEDGNDLGTTTKSVNYSVLYMKAVKALQEAMERIETLEAKVAALEAN